MNCSNPACNGEIKRGERYVAFERHTEREVRPVKVKVEDAVRVAAYHPGCAPKDYSR